MGSAADLMTGLLFVFIIMVAFLALQRKSEQEVNKNSLPPQPKGAGAGVIWWSPVFVPPSFAEMAWPGFEEWRPMLALPGQKPLLPKKSEGANDPRGTVTATIGAEIRKILPTITVDPASGVITLPEDLLFDSGSAELKESAVAKLAEASSHLTTVLRCFVSNQRFYSDGFRRVALACPNNPDGHEIETIFIEGHTDSVPYNKPGGNLGLSLRRANAVNKALVEGKPLGSFRNKDDYPIFSQSAYGESRPLIKADTTDDRNRRVDLRIVLTYRPPETGGAINAAQSAFGN